MKLTGYCLVDQEKPGLLDAARQVRDLSHHGLIRVVPSTC